MHAQTPASLRSDINVTPLVDIVLVLLIVFIVLTPVVNQAVVLPEARHARRVEGPGLVLVLGAKGDGVELYAEGKDAERYTLETCEPLRRKIEWAVRDQRQVLLKGEGSLPYRHLDRVFKLCREGGVEQIDFITAEVANSGRAS